MSFFYNLNGDYMKVYIDLVLFINFAFDFILLLSVCILLKRNIKIKRIILGALFGSISILALFIPFSSFSLFLFKVIMSIFMVIITFKYKNFKYFINNLIYLYIISFILGGFIYYLNNQLSYKNIGIMFYHKNVSINWLLIIILVPLMLILYIYNERKIKQEYSRMYNVKITFLDNKNINLTGFLDTGNNLIDPYKRRPILLINKDLVKNIKTNFLLVPCLTINKTSLIKCFKVKAIEINNKLIKKDILIGISDNNFNIDGVDLLLNNRIGDEILWRGLLVL